MLDWICSQIGSWIRRWTEFDAKMFPSSKTPKIFVFVAISSVTWMDSHLGIETTGRLVEICEIGEITGKSSEIRARGSPRWAAVHFILRCIEPSRVQRVEKVTINQGGAGNHFFAFFPKENIFQTPFVLCSDGSDEKRNNSRCTNRCYSTNQCMSDFFKTLLAAVQLFDTQNPDVFPFLAFPCKTQ